MLGPLVILAIGSAGAGFVPIPTLIEAVFRLPVAEAHHGWLLPVIATLTAVAGIAAAWYAYVKATQLPAQASQALAPLQRLFEKKYFFDEVYNAFTSRAIVAGSDGLLWRRVDAGLVDGAVNGSAAIVGGIARWTRYFQVGLVRAYALVILGGSVALLAYMLWMS